METVFEQGTSWIVQCRHLVRRRTEHEAELTGVDENAPENYRPVEALIDFGYLAPLELIARNALFSGEGFGDILTVRDRAGELILLCATFEEFTSAYIDYLGRHPERTDIYNYRRIVQSNEGFGELLEGLKELLGAVQMPIESGRA